MEAHMIDAVLAASAEVLHPSLHSHVHMSRQRPYGSIVLATEKYLVAVGIEVSTLYMEILEARQNI